jgi:probable rRNA maturation factor
VVQVLVQMALDDSAQQDVPDDAQIQLWVNAAVNHVEPKPLAEHVTVRIVERDEITQLNAQYRQKTGPTNVLSFPCEPFPGLPTEAAEELGDVVVCAAVVADEAVEQNKVLTAHWAHMIVHGTLHLMGFDHLNDSEAEAMESLEVVILAELGFADPYS